MRANGWDVISHRPKCNLTMRVDLALIERVSGSATAYGTVSRNVAGSAARERLNSKVGRFLKAMISPQPM